MIGSRSRVARLAHTERICSVIAAVLAFFSGGSVCADESLSSIASEVQRVFAAAQGAVVHVKAEDDNVRLAGTGFLVDPSGTIYTSYSVAGESHDIVVEYGSSRYPAQRLISDIRSGIAILKIHASTPFLTVGDSDELKIATPVITIGFPLDLPLTPNCGLVGGLDQGYLDRYFWTTLIRANIPPERGQLGSPLLNLRGEVVGIVLGPVDNQTKAACYVLPIKAAEKIRADYMRFGEVRSGWVGIDRVDDASQEDEGSRATIASFAEESPAAASGLLAGDILLQVGSVKIRSKIDVIDASFFLTPGVKTPITVLREGRRVTLEVTPQTHRDKLPLFAPGNLLSKPDQSELRTGQ